MDFSASVSLCFIRCVSTKWRTFWNHTDACVRQRCARALNDLATITKPTTTPLMPWPFSGSRALHCRLCGTLHEMHALPPTSALGTFSHRQGLRKLFVAVLHNPLGLRTLCENLYASCQEYIISIVHAFTARGMQRMSASKYCTLARRDGPTSRQIRRPTWNKRTGMHVSIVDNHTSRTNGTRNGGLYGQVMHSVRTSETFFA